jgi:hypothetical protein
MIGSNLARLSLTSVLARLALLGLIQLWMVYAFALLFGLADAFFPAHVAVQPTDRTGTTSCHLVDPAGDNQMFSFCLCEYMLLLRFSQRDLRLIIPSCLTCVGCFSPYAAQTTGMQ